MPSFLLDTHIVIWWQSDPARLKREHAVILRDLERQGQAAAISAITLRELAKAVEDGRLKIAAPLERWLEEIENHPLLMVLPITSRIALESVRLGTDFPRDPADQIIVATARCHGLRLMTADGQILRWGKVPLA